MGRKVIGSPLKNLVSRENQKWNLLKTGFKRCSRCGDEKALCEFDEVTLGFGGRAGSCTACEKKRSNQYRMPKGPKTPRQELNAWRRVRKARARLGLIDFYVIYLTSRGGCYLCRKPLSGPVTLDHVVPLARGGAHSTGNLRFTHHRCNELKANHHLSELDWYAGPVVIGQVSPQHRLT